jgi:hypothetical protein
MQITIHATEPCLHPPAWAVLERALFAAMNAAIDPYLAKYTNPDGTLIWGGTAAQHGRDDVDDFYEAFYNWPLLYLLGGDDRLLELSLRQWEAVTRQLGALGLLHREFERGADQFHQGESLIYFYFLCLADPANPRLRDLAQRFADFYTGADPDAPNYDPVHKIIRAPHNGSAGPRWGYKDVPLEQFFAVWDDEMRRYGLPFDDVPGVTSYDDLLTPAGAQAMGEAMQSRYGRGDTATNLLVTSLATNAYLLTGEPRFRTWVAEYTAAWIERAVRNGGLLPDNVGLNGEVGEYTGGRWYGGLYGWTWPHGFYNIGMAALVAGINAFLLTGEVRFLDLPRWQMDAVLAQGILANPIGRSMSLAHHLEGQIASEETHPRAFLVPYRYGDRGWFDYQPLPPTYPVALWFVARQPGDWARIERLRQADPSDWRAIWPGRGKEDSTHEGPWLCFLQGENPDYPERFLVQSLGHVYRRLELIRQDSTDLHHLPDNQIHTLVHIWQNVNPVTTEALVQLTLGGPQIIYNGGLLHVSVRYFDAVRRRPGLPEDVAALVERIGEDGITLHLVNLSPLARREVIVQAGAFAEHCFTSVRYGERISDYPGSPWSYHAPPLEVEARETRVDAPWLRVVLPPGTQIRLDLGMQRYVGLPTYCPPWGSPEEP